MRCEFLVRLPLLLLLLLLIPSQPAGAESDLNSYLSSAVKSIETGDYHSALKALRKAIKLDPQNPEALYYMGVVEFNLGESARALSRFRAAHEALSLRPPTLTLIPSDRIELIPTYKDGWKVYPKGRSRKLVLQGGSSYRIDVGEKGESKLGGSILIPVALMLVWIVAR